MPLPLAGGPTNGCDSEVGLPLRLPADIGLKNPMASLSLSTEQRTPYIPLSSGRQIEPHLQ
jgi:hypothetical protein